MVFNKILPLNTNMLKLGLFFFVLFCFLFIFCFLFFKEKMTLSLLKNYTFFSWFNDWFGDFKEGLSDDHCVLRLL